MTKRRKRKKTKKINKFGLLIFLLALIYSAYLNNYNSTFSLPNTTTTVESKLTVSYLDVGQADSILIQNQNEAMLIDAGNNEDGELLVNYFKSLNITNFKYVVGTHPHEDHIGGLDDIINNFTINTIYLPDVITTTTTFTDVLEALEKKNLTYTVPTIDETFSLGDATIKVIYTGTDSKDLNNSSIVLKLSFGSTTFLFTGDATTEVEEKIINKDIQVDVLKVGHHGSKYSSSKAFLQKVNPKYAIISVGKNNSYNHPNEETLKKLNSQNIEIHRTDEEGTIVVTSDGTNITITNIKTNTNGG